MVRNLRIVLVTSIVVLIVAGYVLLTLVRLTDEDGPRVISISDVLGMVSERTPVADAILVDSQEPMLGLIAAPAACWYNIGGSNESGGGKTGSDPVRDGLRPLLATEGGSMEPIQERFLEYLGINSIASIGAYPSEQRSIDQVFSGTPSSVSLQVARSIFKSAPGAMIVMDDTEGYELGILAAPIASYLNVPVIVLDRTSDPEKVSSELRSLGATYIISIGSPNSIIESMASFDQVQLGSENEILDAALTVIKDRFDRIDYLVLTNPSDAIPPHELSSSVQTFDQDVTNLRVETSQIKSDIIGESEHTFSIDVPPGINVIRIYINFTSVEAAPLDPMKENLGVEPSIFATLYDPNGALSTYAPSFSREAGKDYLEAVAVECPGEYSLNVKVFYGIKGLDTYGGTSVGVSRIDAVFHIDAWTTSMETAHAPMFPKLSMLSPYFAAAHGGMVVADPEFEVTTEDFTEAAKGYSSGPCYEENLHPYINGKVGYTEARLAGIMDMMEEKALLEGYLGGPAWLSIMAGPDMVPQYYERKDPSWEEELIYGAGWPTDLNYTMGLKLSMARTIAHDVMDTSTLIARTLFYEDYSIGHGQSIEAEYGTSEVWGRNFHFVAGELGGRTGWFFWQRTFSDDVRGVGFQTEEYLRNSENDRQTMVARGAYERANYLDLMMHGNWYWYVTELNGADSYSTSVKVSDVITDEGDWELGPSVVVTGSCILGRTDGIPPRSSLTMAFLHAGVNAFFGATRSTGSEAKAGTIETSLIYDDLSVGEANRADKLENQEPAAYYVRVLFADPAFNPYEPLNGYSDQGRPELAR